MTDARLRQPISRMFAAILLIALSPGCSSGEPSGVDPYLVNHERSTLTVETMDGKTHAFDVFLATSPEKRATGLMYVEELAPDAGMLFFFEVSRRLSFYMKNTILPLDILFIDSGGRIVNIAEHTTPYSLESVPSDGRARAVLELNAGTSKRLAITPGARVIHPFFR